MVGGTIDIRQKYNWERVLLWMMLSLMAFVFFRDVLSISVNRFVILGIVSLCLIILPYKYCLYFTAFLMPFLCSILGYVLTVALICLICKGENLTVYSFVPISILLILELCHLTFMQGIKVDIKEYIMYSTVIALFFYLIFNNKNDIDVSCFIFYYLLGTTFILFVVSLQLLCTFGIDEIAMGVHRSGARMGDDAMEVITGEQTGLNANNIAFFSITNISLLLLGKKNLNLSKVTIFIMFVVALLAGLISVSRTWMMLLAIVLLAYMILQRNFKQFFIALLSILILTFVVILSESEYTQMVYTMFEGRFEDANMSTAGGRTDLFKAYNDFWLQNFEYILTGTGVIYYRDIANLPNSLHNSTQQIYVCTGIVGVVVFLSVIINYFRLYVRGNKIPYLFYLPFFTCLVFSQSIQFFNPYYLIFPFVFTAFVFRLKLQE